MTNKESQIHPSKKEENILNTAENELRNAFDYMKSDPKSTVYNPTDLRRRIEKAREQGVDVSVFEAKLPELDKRFVENE